MVYVSLEDAALNGYEVERKYLCQVHGDRSASASLNMNGKYICYSCGDRGQLDMSKIEITPKAVKKFIERVEDKLFPTHKVFSESYLDVFDSDGPGDYWLNRYNAETCRHYRLGTTIDRPTYPMRGLNGEVLGIVYRSDGPQKYKYPFGVKVSRLLFDIHRLESTDLVLTEGSTDAMACWEVGVPAGTSSYRNGLTVEQADLIRKYNPRTLWVAYDRDRAGDDGYRKIRGMLDGVNVKRLEWRFCKDLSEMSLEYRKEVLDPVLT